MKRRILLTDDDPEIRDVCKIIFERAGNAIEVKEDGSDILKNNYTKPDLFLIDKQPAGTDGLDLCRYLKKQPSTKNIPVIIVSAPPDIGLSAKNAGADGYIETPFKTCRRTSPSGQSSPQGLNCLSEDSPVNIKFRFRFFHRAGHFIL